MDSETRESENKMNVDEVIDFITSKATEQDLVKLQPIFDDYTCQCWNFCQKTNTVYMKTGRCKVHNTKEELEAYENSPEMIGIKNMINEYKKERVNNA